MRRREVVMPRVLHVVHGYPPEFGGGTERYVRRLVAVQCELGIQARVLTGTAETAASARVETRLDGEVPVHRLKRPGLCGDRWDRTASPAAEGKIAALLRAWRPDVLHLHHWVRLSRAVARLAAAAGIPVVWTLHDLSATCPRFNRVLDDGGLCELPPEVAHCAPCAPADDWQHPEERNDAVRSYLDDLRRELSACTRLLAPSAAQRAMFCARLGLPAAAVTVLPHGVLHSLPPVGPRRADPDGRVRIGHWGYWYRDKGTHLIVDALELLSSAEHARLHLRLFGRAVFPAYGQDIEARAANLPITIEGPFEPGSLPGAELDLALVSSLAHESHAFVIDEAFQLGLPVLASAIGALPERVGAAGRLFPAGDAAALAACLRQLIAAPERIEAWRAAIPQSLPSMAEHARRLETLYGEAIAAGPPAAAPPPPPRSRERRLRERVVANRELEIGRLRLRLGD